MRHNLGETPIALGEKTYSLTFDHNAQADLEAELGIVIGQDNPFAMGTRGLRALLWAGLRKTMPRLTLRDAGLLLDESTVADVYEPIAHAFALSQMSEEEYQEQKKKLLTSAPKNA